MDVNLFVAAMRSIFIHEFQTNAIGVASVDLPVLGIMLSFERVVPLRDIDDDFVSAHRLAWIGMIQEAKSRLPAITYSRRNWFMNGRMVKFSATVYTNAGTPQADMDRAIRLWGNIDLSPLTDAEIAWREEQDGPIVWHEIPAPLGGWQHVAPVAPVEEPISTFDLAASLSDGASLTPRRFNSEGGFSDN